MWTYYAEIWKDRWPQLRSALERPPARYGAHLIQADTSLPADVREENLHGIRWIHSEVRLPPPGANYYPMNKASALAALALPLKGKKHIVDLCAAPGGKTLILALRMGEGAILTANEPSRARRERLKGVIRQYLPQALRERVFVKGLPGEVLARKPALQLPDAVLLDVPCSSEQHVLQSAEAMKEWSHARSLNLQKRQWMLLSNALHWVTPGGHVLYSTCSIHPDENENLVARAFERKGISIEEEHVPSEITHSFERRKFGYLALPDTGEGIGPIYFCLLKKTQ